MTTITRPATTLPVVEALGITRNLGTGAASRRALGPLDVAIRPGELVLVMGPSGSGKSTLVSILGLLSAATRGRVRLAGIETAGLSERVRCRLRREHVAFVFQHFNLIESLTAEENVRVGCELAGLAGQPARDRAADLLDRLGLGDRRRARPRELSGGQKQRVGIARALAMPGRLILADEPTAALDTESGAAVMGILARLAVEEGRAVLAVTHDPRWRPLATRVLHLHDGTITPTEGEN